MKVERLMAGTCGRPFPVYDDLVARLLAAHGPEDAGRDALVAHVLGTCAGYAYADIETVAMIMTRLGLEGSACVRVTQTVDAMFIFSTAYLVQSGCGRVAILCYRGTEPANLGNWLADADVGSDSITLGSDALVVHAGFHRNVQATRSAVIDELSLALEGRSLLDPRKSVEHPLEVLYVTGHSLGGAMAVLFALSLAGTVEHRKIAGRLRAIYTFGQPLATGEPLPEVAREVGRKLFRNPPPAIPSPVSLPPPGGISPISGRNTVTRRASGGVRSLLFPSSQICDRFRARSWVSSRARSAVPRPAMPWPSTGRITTSRRFDQGTRSRNWATAAERFRSAGSQTDSTPAQCRIHWRWRGDSCHAGSLRSMRSEQAISASMRASSAVVSGWARGLITGRCGSPCP